MGETRELHVYSSSKGYSSNSISSRGSKESDEAYMKDLKETHDKPSESLDMDCATTAEKTK